MLTCKGLSEEPSFYVLLGMSRRIRFIPEGAALVEVTCRALHSRLLFRPSPELNQIIIGTLARAKRRYDVRVCFFVCISNHLHMLLGVDDAQQLARFVGYFSSKLAKEVGRLTGWTQKIFGRRYQAIVVSDEEAAQLERLRYGLAHGCKEDLVERPRDWPGVHAVRAMLEGEVLEGLWFDRTKEYAARRRGESFDRLQYATREVLELDPLPCWKHLTEEQRRERTASLVADIETEAAARRQRTGIRPRGPAAILAQNPLRRPLRTKKSPAPAFHAASQAVRRELRDAYGWFVGAFRQAAEKLRAGDRNAVFPAGSFPPALKFVGG
jgi:REP element-mobilizing transposase RayT